MIVDKIAMSTYGQRWNDLIYENHVVIADEHYLWLKQSIIICVFHKYLYIGS